jgi:hypothetical protein
LGVLVRRQWSSARYWQSWWRDDVSPDAKIVVAVVAIGLLGIGGYAAANGLESTAGGDANDAELALVTTTVRKLVTVEKSGGVVTVPGRVVTQRVDGGVTTDRVTQVRVEAVAEPGETRVVTEREVVPVVRRQRVTVPGGVRTVVTQVTGPALTGPAATGPTVTRTVERVEERVVTVVATRTVTETVAVTVATPPVTVTAGPITLTITLPLPLP